jgi:hypothetical protein
MYLVTTTDEYMAGLTKHLQVRIPYDHDLVTGHPITVEESEAKVINPNYTRFELSGGHADHTFYVILVHGDVDCAFVPAGSIQDASAHALSHANTYVRLILPAIKKYIEGLRIREQAEADALMQSTNS